MELHPDTLLHERYCIIRPLGKGGMGVVYLAFDVSLEHEVALKSNIQISVDRSDQFMHEARLLAKLRHPNLPRVIDYFVEGETQYLVMDYISGVDLETLLTNEGPQPIEKVLRWAKQLGDALGYLHSQSPPVIHRDIKPANIKINPNDEVVLVDFGLSKATDASQATSAGAVGYTPGYAPPEQYGSQHTGPFSDQYALAATIYRMLTGVRPADSVQRALGEAVLAPINQLESTIPLHIQTAIEKAMTISPAGRFFSVTEFTTALGGENKVSNLPAKKNPPWVLFAGVAALLVFGLLIIIFGVFLWGRNKASSATASAIPTIIQATPVQNTAEPVLQTPPDETEPAPVIPTILPSSTPTPLYTPTPEALALGNGKEVAFVSDRGDGKTLQIYTMKIWLGSTNEINASQPVQRTFDEGNKQFPAWSPDGTHLVYSAPGPVGNGLDLWTLDVSSEEKPMRLTELIGDDTHPDWSPDGRWIAFVNLNPNNEAHEINLVDASGSNRRRLTVGYDELSPIWSPDMEWQLYVRYASDHRYFWMRRGAEIFATPASGGDPNQTPTPTVTPDRFDPSEMFGRLGDVGDPSWSSDGKYIAYTRFENLTRRIYSVDFQSHGSAAYLLSEGGFKEYDPSWSPDGQYIAFTSERDGNPEIYVMTSTGKMQTNLTLNAGNDMQPAWQR